MASQRVSSCPTHLPLAAGKLKLAPPTRRGSAASLLGSLAAPGPPEQSAKGSDDHNKGWQGGLSLKLKLPRPVTRRADCYCCVVGGRTADSLQTKCGHLFSLPADLARTAWSLPCCTRALIAADDMSCNVGVSCYSNSSFYVSVATASIAVPAGLDGHDRGGVRFLNLCTAAT